MLTLRTCAKWCVQRGGRSCGRSSPYSSRCGLRIAGVMGESSDGQWWPAELTAALPLCYQRTQEVCRHFLSHDIWAKTLAGLAHRVDMQPEVQIEQSRGPSTNHKRHSRVSVVYYDIVEMQFWQSWWFVMWFSKERTQNARMNVYESVVINKHAHPMNKREKLCDYIR